MRTFYDTSKWRKKRLIILKRDKFECQECKRYGKSTEALIVHHVNPLEFNPLLALINLNLLSLCKKCHGQMHIRDSHELTEKGKEWVERVAPQLNCVKF
ncbi:HNH endonuclease [Jeotgalibacillus sp. S-D1]|uniref:HNH endonuclease n=1 Tax=Jeotgalibacillus sp. S-D1 TaxID=2552189 RepID=UPI00105A2CE8|nr:HNH endonuclease [Jeotgalibacillus sp. S-D1]TDL34567.1 HNH endonuclease [Jeotgalibacillus sp. S-D1]